MTGAERREESKENKGQIRDAKKTAKKTARQEFKDKKKDIKDSGAVSYTHLRAHETGRKSRMPSSA